mgnify:CR=1 FL=1
MDTELIIVSEYCSQNRIEPEFLFSLEEVGLVDFIKRNDEYYLYISQLGDLDRYVRWHYELSIDAEGIDVIQNLMNRINEMQGEISRLKEIIRLLEE